MRRIVKSVKNVLGNGKPKNPGTIHRVVCKELNLSGDSELREAIWNLVGRGEVRVVGNWNLQLVK